ncbi:hypothetical protein D770_08865 [Flammeovirgaceae bacterium 311]|nr:hypothetical protein D770_08865 [Flammeovirgaceae bacterium 311]
METTDFLIIYLPSLLFFIVWLTMQQITGKHDGKLFLLLSTLIILLLIIGFITSALWTEITPVGNALLFSSPLWLLGPALIYFGKKVEDPSKRRLIGSLMLILLSPLSSIGCFFLLLLTGQVTGT